MHHFLCIINPANFWPLDLNMTKRDSFTANLASPRDLRMASGHDPDLPVNTASGSNPEVPSYGYSAPSVPTPMPGLATSTIPTGQEYSQLQQAQWRQRIVHTHTFKIFEYGTGFTRPAELVVDEVDSMGHSRIRSLEQFFYGIVGHVKDKRGSAINGWRQAARVANYWRRYFGAAEEQEPEPSQEETPSQWILHEILSQDTSLNAPILQALQHADPSSSSATPAHSALLNHEGWARHTLRSWGI